MRIIKQTKTSKQISIIIASVMACASMTASAALPPQYQNLNDMNVMVDFAKKRTQVMQELKRIDVENLQIVFSSYSKQDKAYKDCVIQFTRKSRGINPPPGPAGELIFKKSSCPLYPIKLPVSAQ